MKVELSVICLAYNHEKYIHQALDSVISQCTDFPFEIIVSDDASIDKTGEIIKKYYYNNPGLIRVVCHKDNQYLKGKDIIGPLIDMARGRYIAFCECDDFYNDVNKFQRQYDYLNANDQIVGTIHKAWVVDESGRKRIGERDPKIRKDILEPKDIIESCFQNYALNSLMVRKEILYPFPHFYYTASVQDIPIALIMASKGAVHYDPTPMSSYRRGALQSWTQRASKSTAMSIRYYNSLIDMFLAFDLHTQNKYSDCVAYKIETAEFWRTYNTDPREILKQVRYREYMEHLEIKTKIRIVGRIFLSYMKERR